MRLVAALLMLLATFGTVTARAAAGPWASAPNVRVRLLAATSTAGQGRVLHAALQVVLDDGWDTYWRSPGDAGAPPTVDWSGSTNVASVDWRWPAPIRFTVVGLETFGYLHEVIFPLTVHPRRPGETVALRGQADLLVCSTVCVPKHLAVSLDLPAGAATPDAATANLIARYEARVPVDASRSGLVVPVLAVPGLAVNDAEVEPGNPAFLKLRITSREPLSPRTDVIVESPKWSFGHPTFSFGADGETATALLPVTGGPEAVAMPGAGVTITLEDGARASETAISVRLGMVRQRGWLGGLVPVLGAAFLGGLVLNLMPCVLPVLGLKLLAVLRHRGRARRDIRFGFVATAAGIVASMLALAAILAGLRAAGLAVGWGMQFQQPAFPMLMAGALLIFAANLAGLWELALPTRLATALGTTGGNGLVGSFLAGAFTTVLATPCSAPFVGTAVAFALTRGTAEILAIFGLLGIGLATPHLLVAAFPALVRCLPKPGRWMMSVRRVLALALTGTAAWLLTVLAAQTSWPAAGAVGAALVLLTGALALRGRVGAPVALGLAVVALAGAAAAPAALRRQSAVAAATSWMPFDETNLRRLVAEGRTVFVDVTAEWCVNCKANEALVLARTDIAAALREPGTVAMQADWTRPDPRISDYLARNNRFGIPFDAVYGPGAPRGVLLSEVLTREAVLAALRQARGVRGRISLQ